MEDGVSKIRLVSVSRVGVVSLPQRESTNHIPYAK